MTLTGDTGFNRARGSWRIPRSRGAVTGLLLMLLGAWGTLIPFIGPAFNFGFGGAQTWDWTAARFWLEVLPGIAAFVGGLMLTVSANRGTTMLGAWLAIAAGTWFIIGPTLATPWNLGDIGVPMGTTDWRHALTWLLFFYGLGAAILFLASTAQGRLSVRSLRDIEHAQMRAQSKMLARRAHGGGLLGRLHGGRERRPEPVGAGRAGRDDRDWTDRSDQAGVTERERAGTAPAGRSSQARRDERVDHTAARDVYPSDAARASRTEQVDDRAPRDSRHNGEVSSRGRSATTTTTEPSAYPSGDRAQTDESAGGRHEAPHEGLGDKIGRTLARHGIGGRH